MYKMHVREALVEIDGGESLSGVLVFRGSVKHRRK